MPDTEPEPVRIVRVDTYMVTRPDGTTATRVFQTPVAALPDVDASGGER